MGIAHILKIYEWEYFDVLEAKKRMLDQFDMVTTGGENKNKVYNCISSIYMHHFNIGSILKKNKIL